MYTPGQCHSLMTPKKLTHMYLIQILKSVTLCLVCSSQQSTNLLNARSKPSTISEGSIERFLKLGWLSRNNLSSPSFALVTYMKSFYKIWSEIQSKIKWIFWQISKDKFEKKTNKKILGWGEGGRGCEHMWTNVWHEKLRVCDLDL